MDEKRYTKGFNHGYVYKKYRGELFEHMLNGIDRNSEYALGFGDGGKQYEKERTQQQLKQRLEQTRGKGRSQ